MRHLLSLSTASLFPLVRHGGRFAQSGKDPRVLLVPSYKTAKTAKTAPVGLCGPVWPPGGGIVYVPNLVKACWTHMRSEVDSLERWLSCNTGL